MECARNMILTQGLGLELWGEVVSTTIYIKKSMFNQGSSFQNLLRSMEW
jgi:hypothetical protein